MKKLGVILMILALGVSLGCLKAHAIVVTATTDLYCITNPLLKIGTVSASATNDSAAYWQYSYTVTNLAYTTGLRKFRVYNPLMFPITGITTPSSWSFAVIGDYFEWATSTVNPIDIGSSELFEMRTLLETTPGLQRADVWDSPDQGTGQSLSPVPEPATMLLLGSGLLGLAGFRRIKRRKV